MNKKLHILFLCGWYPSRVLPTNGDFIYRHAKAVAKLHQVSVLHIITDANVQKTEIVFEEIDGIQTYIGYVPFTKNPFKKAWLFYEAYVKIRKKIGGFDLIHLNEFNPFGVYSVVEKWFAQKKYIVTEHNTIYLGKQKEKLTQIQILLCKLIAKNASFICPVTTNLQQALQNLGINGTYQVIENVVDTTLFAPIINTNSTFKIIHISNMDDAQKNVSGLLKAIENCSEAIENLEVMIIGANASKYQHHITKKEHFVTFHNHLPHHQLVSYLQQANVLVLFSNYENLPCVILEAFACGVFVIATDVGGIAEYFPSNFGKLIQPKKTDQLENALLDFYKNPHQKADNHQMHMYMNQHFSENAIATKFSNCYQIIINN